MSENFQIVLYYNKRVIIGGKPSLKSFIEAKKKFANSELDMDSIFDEYNDNKTAQGREEIVGTFCLIYDDEDFINNVLNVEQSDGFVEWESDSNEIIKQKMFK